ncbi:SH3 domain-containing protein [Sphingobacterium griseoflavum]|uniref:SH3b domain-containing protein n=1 Tax=Sphingobacterium griseoflavum TaxID=1474952 RepID=A0ABQ3HS97_9SPHI|nr:SH3 domain-containing protein [Sphingobacterium griseoflavum]GHE23213.1 hypothetical protein GCM10017764_01810 [Sphingobacterium griseoflavum]
MALVDKYKLLLDTAKSAHIEDLHYQETDGVLHINGTAPDADVKNKLWNVYNQIDPNYISNEVAINVDLAVSTHGILARIITQDETLNIRKGPSIEQPILVAVNKNDNLFLISLANDQWWLVRTEQGQEGYCYAQYVEPIA